MSVAVGQSVSPFYHSSSPGSFSLLLEQRSNQCVPGSPSLSPASIYGTTALSRRLTGVNGGSPAGQTVPDAVNIQRSGGYSASGTTGAGVYSGSPLLRQILRSGRKRQREDDGHSPSTSTVPSSPSPIALSSKRFRHDSPQVPNSLVVLERRNSTITRNIPLGFEQIVPRSPMIQTHEPSTLEVFQANSKMETTDSCAPKESVNHTKGEVLETKGDVNWFDLLSADNIFVHREE